MAAAGMSSYPRIPTGQNHHMVPNYDLHGNHHCRNPYKDFSHLQNAEVNHPKWLGPQPDIRSRAELQQARKRANVPDASYDFDKDGVVGALDHFIGRQFDSDNDGRLTTGERRRADAALQSGFLDKYVRGLDQTHPKHKGTIKQTRGAIMVDGDATVLHYPPHWNADKVPNNPTKVHMELARRAEAKCAGNIMGNQMADQNAPVLERHPPTHKTHPRQCPIENIRERAEADHQAARVAGGLMPMGAPVNPEREARTLSLDHVYEPLIPTRGALLETRKEAMKQQCEELRMRGDAVNVPLAVQKAQKEAKEYEFRRPDPGFEPQTLSKLKDSRKRAAIEHNMEHFDFPKQNVYPRFSDNPDVPFWLAGQEASAVAPAHTAPIPKSMSEPALKVNHVPFAHDSRDDNHDLPEAAHDVARAAGNLTGTEVHYGSATKKRWTADMIDRGQGRNKPRLFDSIQPARVGPRDLETLDLTSSMEHIRRTALKKRNEERVRNKMNPRRSRLWSDPSQQGMSITAPGGASAMPSKGHPVSSMDSSMDWQNGSSVSRSMEGPNTSANMTNLPSKPKGPQVRTLTMSDPAMRTAGQVAMAQAQTMREPRFFGSQRPNSQHGVRSGGFERLEMGGTQPKHMRATRSTRGNDHSTSAPPAPQLPS